LSGTTIRDLSASCFVRRVNRGSNTFTTVKADRFKAWVINGLGGLNHHLKAA